MTPQELLEIAAWADSLTAQELAKAAGGVRTRSFVRAEYVSHFNDVVDAWYGVLDGVVRTELVSNAGQVASFSAILGGGWFGEGSLMKREPRRYDVVAVTDATVAIMRGDTFRWLSANSVGFNRYLVSLLNERLGHFIATVFSDRTGNSTARLAHTIMMLYNPVLFPRTPMCLNMPQEDLGIFAGLSRQMTNRCLKQLASEGLLELTSKGIRVVDLQGLASFDSSQTQD
jgi:CRP-like cAMP-binding protein